MTKSTKRICLSLATGTGREPSDIKITKSGPLIDCATHEAFFIERIVFHNVLPNYSTLATLIFSELDSVFLHVHVCLDVLLHRGSLFAATKQTQVLKLTKQISVTCDSHVYRKSNTYVNSSTIFHLFSFLLLYHVLGWFMPAVFVFGGIFPLYYPSLQRYNFRDCRSQLVAILH